MCLFDFLLCLSWHKLDIEVAAIVVTPNVKGVKNVTPIRSVHSQPILFAQLLSADFCLLIESAKPAELLSDRVQLTIQKIQGLRQIFHCNDQLFPGGSFCI